MCDMHACMQISKKIKSMQMFKRPVQSCKQVGGPPRCTIVRCLHQFICTLRTLQNCSNAPSMLSTASTLMLAISSSSFAAVLQ